MARIYTPTISIWILTSNNNLEIGNFGIIAVINTEEDLDHSSLNFSFIYLRKILS